MIRKLVLAALVGLVVLALAAGFLLNRLLDPQAVRVAVERQASELLAQPVRIGSIDWALALRPRVVLGDVAIGEPAAIQLQRVELTTDLRALLSKRVEGAGLVVGGSRIRLPLPFTLGAADGAGPAPAPTASASDAAASAALAIVSVDQIALRDIELLVGEKRLVVDLESSLSGRRLTVSSVRLSSERTVIQGSGELPDIGGLSGRFSLSAETLDLDELLTVAAGISASGSEAASRPTAGSSPPAAQAPLDLRIDLKAARGRALGQDFTDLSASLALTREGLQLEPVTLNLLGGRLDGRLRVDTSQPSTQVSLAADVQAMEVAQLAALADAKGAITGRLGGQLRLEARADAAGVSLGTARGTATLAITDGTMPGLDLVRPVITAFGTTGQVARGGSEFSRVGGTFRLASGVLSSDDLTLASPDADMRGRGTVRLADLVVDVRADLVLSEALSAQAGRDLRRYAREGSRIVVPATVKGPLASPTVFVDVSAALQRATRNLVEDELKKGLRRLLPP